jgi:hypothetical protein
MTAAPTAFAKVFGIENHPSAFQPVEDGSQFGWMKSAFPARAS